MGQGLGPGLLHVAGGGRRHRRVLPLSPFTRRTAWSRAENPLARAARLAPPEIDLTISNPTRVGLPYPEAALLEALALPASLAYRPEPRGLRAAREAVSAYYARRGLRVDPERIVLTASTSEAYAFLFRLLLEPEDEVLVPAPSYPLFEFLTGLSDVRARPYRSSYDGAWFLDDALERGPRTRALLVVSPNNPTGAIHDPAERARLAGLGLPVIADEVFADYAQGHAAASWIDGAELVFSLGGLSKAAALPQLKLGWIVVSGSPALVEEALARLELIADTYLSVGTPLQVGLARVLELGERVQAELTGRLAANRETIARAVRDSPLSLLASRGGWYAMLDLPRTESDETWALALLERGVLAHPGYLYDAERTCLVLSTILEPAALGEGLARLLALVAERLG